jgi:hypothetical protein
VHRAEVLAQIIDQAFADAKSPDHRARIGNAVQAVMRARPEMAAPDALATVWWLVRGPFNPKPKSLLHA